MRNLAVKKVIRQEIIQKRKELQLLEWQEKTAEIQKRLIGHPWFREAFEIYCYVDFNGETGTRGIIEEAWKLGKQTAVPKVSGNRMDFYYMESWDELKPGKFGILEPDEKRKADGKDGLLIMPGVAFDKRLHRIGYGKGYYDRYLYSHPGLKTIAIAFQMQIVEDIKPDAFDISPQILITEA